jgi:hypothetical protein
MNAPFMDFIRRFKELERENAAQSASSPPQTILIRNRPIAVRALPTVHAIDPLQGRQQVAR